MAERNPATSRPRVAWFSPFHEGSAIAGCSLRITNELSKSCDVDIWYPELAKPLPSDLTRRGFDPEDAAPFESLREYDHVVYNLGNNYEFHGGIFETQRRHPGILVVHDFVMYHFFAARQMERSGDPASFVGLFRKHYGPEAADRVLRSLEGSATPITESSSLMDWPLLEEAIGGARGILVHSRFLEGRVRPHAPCPVAVVNLPRIMPHDLSLRTRRELDIPADKVSVVIAGQMNANKRAEQTLRVISANPRLREKVVVSLVGTIGPGYLSDLRELATNLGLSPLVRLTGTVNDSEFYSYLDTADVCVNLRYPNTEGASGSLIEQMMFGNAVLVLNSGFFAEVPADTVHRIDLDAEQDEIAAGLERLVCDTSYRARVATRAKEYAESTFREDQYAARVLQLFDTVSRVQPLMDLVDGVGETLRQLGVSRGDPIVERTLETVMDSFWPNGEGNVLG